MQHKEKEKRKKKKKVNQNLEIPHSSTLAWKIPWTEEPGRLHFMGPLRVGHDWATSLSLSTFMHWRRKWQPLQCDCLENPRDGGAWWAAIYGVTQSRTRLKWLSSSSPFMVAKSRTRLSDFLFTFHFHALEKDTATHSSVLVWRIPGMGVPDGLLSMGSHEVRHDWSDLAAAAALLYGASLLAQW